MTVSATGNRRALLDETPVVLHQRIRRDLVARIAQGEWVVGKKIPSRQALAREYGVDLGTIQPAIASLMGSGLLHAIDRKGTYVTRQVQPADMGTPAAVLEAPTVYRSSVDSEVSLPFAVLPVHLGILTFFDFDPTGDVTPYRDNWSMRVITHLEKAVSEYGGTTSYLDVLAKSAELPNIQDDVSTLRAQGANILVLVDVYGFTSDRMHGVVSYLDTIDMPVVIVVTELTFSAHPLVTYDQRYAGFRAMKHLITCGYQDMLFYSPFTANWVRERIEGAHAGVPYTDLQRVRFQVFPTDTTLSDLAFFGQEQQTLPPQHRDALAEFVTAGSTTKLQAIIAPNDVIAARIYTALADIGLQAGRDYGLIGFDDEPVARQHGITTLRPPWEELGELAARLAVRQLHGNPVSLRMCLRSHVIARRTTHRGV